MPTGTPPLYLSAASDGYKSRAQEAPVVGAGSGQSRTDVLAIFMSAILLLTGLQWLSLRPREMKPVRYPAIDVRYCFIDADGVGLEGETSLLHTVSGPGSVVFFHYNISVAGLFSLFTSLFIRRRL